MAIPIKLPTFEGPLDLLLHLIDTNKVNIYDIPIVEITEQYMEYIRQMEQEDLGIMSEFMLMAATLLDIKCRMLLPKEVTEDGEEIDPREELVEKLLEYKMYKDLSYRLRERMKEASNVFFKGPSIPSEVTGYVVPVVPEELLEGMTLNKLHSIFQNVIKRQENKKDPIRSNFGKIEREEVNLAEKMDYIKSYAVSHKRFSFRHLLERQCSKMQVVVTFLGILELMKMGNLCVSQKEIFDDIEIEVVRDVREWGNMLEIIE